MELQVELRMVLDVVIAGVLGGLVGLDRERKEKPAGLRTHTIIGAASCLVTLLGLALITMHESSAVAKPDPVRIIQSIVIGISFLGTGTIIGNEKLHRVEGLTTAASILLTAAVGIAVGIHLYVVAVCVTLLDLFVLAWVMKIEAAVGTKRGDRD